MNNAPQTKPSNVGIRSITNSKKQNEFEKQVLKDLLGLYNKANLLEIDLKNTREMAEIESSYMKLSVGKTQTMLSHFIENYLNSTQEIKTKTAYPSDFTGNETRPVQIDLETFDATLVPAYTESKVNIYDEISDETFIPESLKVELLSEENPGILEILDSDVYQCFDGKSETAWIRKITTDNTVSEVVTVMNIYLPHDIVTTDYVNELIIKPFPVNSIDIKEIKYSSTYDVSYTTILDDLNDYEKNIIKDYRSYIGQDYNESFNIRLNFEEKKIKVLTISFSQKSYVQNGGNRVFYIGAKEIQVNLNKYANTLGELSFRLSLESGTKKIENISPYFNNPSVASENSIEMEIYTVNALDEVYPVESSFPFSTTENELLVKVKIYPIDGKNTPNLSKFKLFYKIL